MGEWQRRRILIWGKTRPEISQRYREIVCTGGVFGDTKRFVRLYPIPLRYMNDDRVFKKYQWIEANVAKSSSDTRPESYKISYDDIQPLGVIETTSGNWDARAEWIMQPHNVFQSVEALQEKRSQDATSIGMIQPKEIVSIKAERRNQQDMEDYLEKYRRAVQQMELDLEADSASQTKPLKPADFRFKIQFRCNDDRCDHIHSFSVLDWEIDALYFNLRDKGDSAEIAKDKVIDKLQNDVCAPNKDLHFFLGNAKAHPQNFFICGLWWPQKKSDMVQLSLL